MANQKNYSPLWFGWLLVVTMTVLLSGCQTAKPARLADKSDKEQSDDWLIVTRDSRQNYRNELKLKIEIDYNRDYVHNGFYLGDDISEVIAILKFSKKNAVMIDSKMKIVPEEFHSTVAQLHQAGIVVKEFWVPIASEPGRIDRMAHHATKIVIRYTDDN